MKKQHFFVGITLICVLFVVMNFYSRKKSTNTAKNIVFNPNQEKLEMKGHREVGTRYISEGNPFDLHSQEDIDSIFQSGHSSQSKTAARSTTTAATTTIKQTTRQTTTRTKKPTAMNSLQNLKVSKSKDVALSVLNTDQIKKLEKALAKIKGMSLSVPKDKSSKQFTTVKSLLVTKDNKIKNSMSDVRIYNWNGSWSLSSMCDGVGMNDFREATLKTMSGPTPIFVYSETEDKYVSHDIINTGWWEHHLAVPMVNMLQSDPTLTFMDVGANIGAFTLEMAKMGRKTISVEPLKDNVQRLCCSVHKGKLGHLVTIIANAISNKHQQVTLGKDLNNVGGTFVNNNNPVKISQIVMNGEYSTPVNTILLDDILGLPEKPERVVMKMDVEGYEHFVLEGATYFFQQVFVKAIFMEWTYSNNPSIRDSIIKFMVNNNFLPYSLSMHESILESNYNAWPGTVVWINKTKK